MGLGWASGAAFYSVGVHPGNKCQLGPRRVFCHVFSRTFARREVGVTSRSCGNLQHFSFWARKMRLVPRFPNRKCTSYCKMQASVLFWTCLKLAAQNRFVLKLPTRTARARNLIYVFRAGSQVRPETLAALWSQWTLKNSIGLREAQIWVKLGVTIYCDLGNEPVLEKGFDISPGALQYLSAGHAPQHHSP